MTKRCIFKIGQVIATNEMREMLPPIYREFLPRGPFTVTDITQSNHKNGGYIMFADAAKRGVTISWFTMFSRFGKKGCRGSGVRPYHSSLKVIDPEQMGAWATMCKKHNDKKTKKNKRTKAVRKAGYVSVGEMNAEERRMTDKTSSTNNTKCYLTLSQFDGEDL
jgi:hypothetical protein